MATILFYEKPGCRNNTRQKEMLELSGHTVEPVNLLEYPWSQEELGEYLGEKPLSECFNPAAPAIKSGELNPQDFSREEALLMMISDPILIRRPLMQIGGHRVQGFDTTVLRELISLTGVPGAESIVKALRMTDMNSCPHINNFSCLNKEH